MPNNNNEPSSKAMNNMLNQLSKKLGTDPQKLKESAQNGDFDSLLKNMNSDDANKMKNLLNDKEATQKIFSSKAFQDLMKKFGK